MEINRTFLLFTCHVRVRYRRLETASTSIDPMPDQSNLCPLATSALSAGNLESSGPTIPLPFRNTNRLHITSLNSPKICDAHDLTALFRLRLVMGFEALERCAPKNFEDVTAQTLSM
jgi:hypothetical protein